MRDSLAAIARALRRASCPLRRGRRCVPGEGPARARIFLIGQAPGAAENRSGRPFVGLAGRYLDRALHEAGIARRDVFLTSVEKHFPPSNRPPRRAEIEACLPFLRRQIAVVDPQLVVLLGRVAQRWMGDDPALRGRCVVSTAHPAAAMRFPRQARRLRRDLALIAAAARPRRPVSPPAGARSSAARRVAARRRTSRQGSRRR